MWRPCLTRVGVEVRRLCSTQVGVVLVQTSGVQRHRWEASVREVVLNASGSRGVEIALDASGGGVGAVVRWWVRRQRWEASVREEGDAHYPLSRCAVPLSRWEVCAPWITAVRVQKARVIDHPAGTCASASVEYAESRLIYSLA